LDIKIKLKNIDKIVANMEELKELKSLILSLSDNEKKDLIKKMIVKNEGDPRNKTLGLFNSILNSTNKKSPLTSDFVVSSSKKETTKKMANRLMDKIYDTILLFDNLKNYSLYDNIAIEIFLLEKQLLISELLRFRGLFYLAEKKLDKVISQCKYFEHYSVLLHAFEKLRKWNQFEKNRAKLRIIDQEYTYFKKCKIALDDSIEIYFQIIKFNTIKVSERDYNYLNKGINKLTYYLKSIDFKLVRFYLYYLIIEKNSLNGNYKICLDYLDELIEYMNENDSIYSKGKLATALLNKGIFYRLDFVFDQSINCILEAKKYPVDQPEINAVIYEHLMLSYYYMGNSIKAKYYLSLINRNYLKNNKIKTTNIDYYIGVFCFINQDFSESNKILNNVIHGNNYHNTSFEIKLLSILNHIELEEFDSVDTKIESLKKYIFRNSNNLSGLERLKIELRVISNLSKNGFDFGSTLKECEIDFLKLNTIQKKYNFKEFQMIPFPDWFESKVKNVPYNHEDVMKRLRKMNKKK